MKNINLHNLKKFSLVIAFVFGTFFANAECEYANALSGQELPIGNMLTWSTKLENDNQHFVIERSANGLEFEQIGAVNGAGNSEAVNDYRFLDTKAQKGGFYYRLKSVDKADNQVETHIIHMNRSMTNNMVITSMSSTSVDRIFEAVLEAQGKDRVDFQIKTKEGALVLEGTQKIRTGENAVLVDMGSLEKGVYEIFISAGDETERVAVRKTGMQLSDAGNFADTKLKLKKARKNR